MAGGLDLHYVLSRRQGEPVREVLRRELWRYAAEAVSARWGSVERGSLTITTENTQGELVGGIYGDSAFGCMNILLLWVREDYRRLGVGTRLLSRAEEASRQDGCRMLCLDTFNFEAPGFYLKRGFEAYGEVEFYAGGPVKYYFKKQL